MSFERFEALPQRQSVGNDALSSNFFGEIPRNVGQVPAAFGPAPEITSLALNSDEEDIDDIEVIQDWWESRMYGPEPK